VCFPQLGRSRNDSIPVVELRTSSCTNGPLRNVRAHLKSASGHYLTVQLDYTPTPRQPTWGFCVRVDPKIEFLDT